MQNISNNIPKYTTKLIIFLNSAQVYLCIHDFALSEIATEY